MISIDKAIDYSVFEDNKIVTRVQVDRYVKEFAKLQNIDEYTYDFDEEKQIINFYYAAKVEPKFFTITLETKEEINE